MGLIANISSLIPRCSPLETPYHALNLIETGQDLQAVKTILCCFGALHVLGLSTPYWGYNHYYHENRGFINDLKSKPPYHVSGGPRGGYPPPLKIATPLLLVQIVVWGINAYQISAINSTCFNLSRIMGVGCVLALVSLASLVRATLIEVDLANSLYKTRDEAKSLFDLGKKQQGPNDDDDDIYPKCQPQINQLVAPLEKINSANFWRTAAILQLVSFALLGFSIVKTRALSQKCFSLLSYR
jgi:hypothetical protein